MLDIIQSIVKVKVDPITKLFIMVGAVVPVAIIYGIMKVIKYFLVTEQDVEVHEEKLPPVKSNPVVYYDVKKLSARGGSLVQHVKFSVIRDNKWVDITSQMKEVKPDIHYYHGRLENVQDTVVLRDYDIIQLQELLGNTKLVKNAG